MRLALKTLFWIHPPSAIRGFMVPARRCLECRHSPGTSMSTTWKSLAVGFGAGVVSTALYFPLGIHVVGGILWGASVAYILVQYYLSEKQAS